MTEQSSSLVLYDISSPLEPRSYAPNPAKARYAVSFKRVPFKTTWVDLLDIADVRKKLKCPAGRKFDDGSDFYTLPILENPATGDVIGDSFDIAVYLDEHFPDSGARLFPPDSTRTGLDYESPQKDTPFLVPLTVLEGAKHQEYAKFNVQVDATFTAYTALVAQFLPFNPKTAEAARAKFVKRAHLKSWDDLKLEGEKKDQLMAAYKTDLTSLANLYKIHDSGPYLEGKQANYADLIVGGWLNMFHSVMPKEELIDFRTWHDGVFARLHDALQEDHYVCK